MTFSFSTQGSSYYYLDPLCYVSFFPVSFFCDKSVCPLKILNLKKRCFSLGEFSIYRFPCFLRNKSVAVIIINHG